MCQGLTLKGKQCKNKQAPYCYLHESQQAPYLHKSQSSQLQRKIPEEYLILNKFLPVELSLKICSYLSFEVTEALCIKKTPCKLSLPFSSNVMTRWIRFHVKTSNQVSPNLLVSVMHFKEREAHIQWYSQQIQYMQYNTCLVLLHHP